MLKSIEILFIVLLLLSQGPFYGRNINSALLKGPKLNRQGYGYGTFDGCGTIDGYGTFDGYGTIGGYGTCSKISPFLEYTFRSIFLGCGVRQNKYKRRNRHKGRIIDGENIVNDGWMVLLYFPGKLRITIFFKRIIFTEYS